MNFKNRIVGSGTANPNELKGNPLNWRKHPELQQNALNDVLSKIGWVQDVIVNKTTGNLVDGHLRVEMAIKNNEDEIPVKYVELSADEEKAILASFDPISAMAISDNETLQELIENTNTDIDLSVFNNNEHIDFDKLLEHDDSSDVVSEECKDDDYFYFSQDELIESMLKEWKSFTSLEEYVSYIISPAKAKYEFNRLCQGYNNVGYNISLLFNPHRLTTKTSKSDMSIYDAWNSYDTYKQQFSRYCVKTINKVTVPTELYRFTGLGSGGIQYVNEFQPYLARSIYKKYCADGFKILDPCSGWGGRTIGLASCLFKDIEYVTTDPSVKTYNGLLKLKEFLHLGDNFKYHNLPFEDFDVKENYFDFCFTSPPYFDTEHYSDDEMESCNRYSESYDAWKNGFLHPMLDKIVFALKDGAHSLLNVGNCRFPIDKDISEYLGEEYGFACRYIKDFKIGGSGIGDRTGEDGEPFIEFVVYKS